MTVFLFYLKKIVFFTRLNDCVTPDYLGDGVWTPPKLSELSANLISSKIKNKKDIIILELPIDCKNCILFQYYKNGFM